MCGILAYIYKVKSDGDHNGYYNDALIQGFNRISKRGPDNTECRLENNVFLGFHRLSINDISSAGNQPMALNDYYLICNGEIFNHEKIIQEYNFTTNSKSDCEVILHLYNYLINKIGQENESPYNDVMNILCNKLDGEFSFVLYDKKRNNVYVARDPYGVRPLFIGNTDNGDYVFSSELKGLHNLVKDVKQFVKIRHQ